jgi:hypothetical protein
MSQSLLKEIRANENYKRFLAIVETCQQRIDVDRSKNEALALHAGRLSRNLHGEKRYSPKHIIDANMQDMANRARMVEIRVKNDIQLSTLRSAIQAMRRHISTEYAEELREFSTAPQRSAFVDRVLKASVQLLEEGEALIELLDTLIKDIDQTSHTMRHIIEALKLVSEKGRNI